MARRAVAELGGDRNLRVATSRPDHHRPTRTGSFEMFIAEQQLIAAAVGLAVRGYVPLAST